MAAAADRAAEPPMLTLQNRWYNGFTAALGLDRATAQIIQPVPLMIPADTALWASQNIIPPDSLTFNQTLDRASTFFGQYAAVIDQLRFPQAKFAQDIGATNYQAWTAYVQSLSPPAAAQLPVLFRAWALKNAPSAVAAGVTDLTATALYAAAQRALLPYEGSGAQPVDYAGTHDDLLNTLSAASGGNVGFDSSATSGDVHHAWAGRNGGGFFGLWAGSDPASRISRKFAAANVTVQVELQAWTVWVSTPGAWYSSSALNAAYTSPGSPPWPPDPDPAWDGVFGPGGALLLAIASLIVADGVAVAVACDADFDGRDKAAILSNSAKGLWPFFTPAGANVSSQVTFNDGGMAMVTVTERGNPVVLGTNVLGIAQYLGHG